MLTGDYRWRFQAATLIESLIGDDDYDVLITDTRSQFYTRIGVVVMSDTAEVIVYSSLVHWNIRYVIFIPTLTFCRSSSTWTWPSLTLLPTRCMWQKAWRRSMWCSELFCSLFGRFFQTSLWANTFFSAFVTATDMFANGLITKPDRANTRQVIYYLTDSDACVFLLFTHFRNLFLANWTLHRSKISRNAEPSLWSVSIFLCFFAENCDDAMKKKWQLYSWI